MQSGVKSEMGICRLGSPPLPTVIVPEVQSTATFQMLIMSLGRAGLHHELSSTSTRQSGEPAGGLTMPSKCPGSMLP